MTLLFDENFSDRTVAALVALGHKVRHAEDGPGRGSADTEVFTFARVNAFYFVTKDARIRRRRHEQETMRQAGIGVFVFKSTVPRGLDQETAFVLQVVGKIEEVIASDRPPFVYEVTDKREVRRLE